MPGNAAVAFSRLDEEEMLKGGVFSPESDENVIKYTGIATLLSVKVHSQFTPERQK